MKDIGISKRKKKIHRTVELALLVLVYIVLFLVQGYINGSDENIFESEYITNFSVEGIISAFEIMIVVMMVCTCREGYYVAGSVLAISIFVMMVKIVGHKNYALITGVAIMFTETIVIQIIHMYLTKISRDEKALYDMANTDLLTDLPNRRALKQKMVELLEESHIKNNTFAIVMIDLDNFKNINDTAGHDYGDMVLSGIANRWRDVMNNNDFMSRLGGDEFALLVSGFSSFSELDTHLNEIMSQVEEKFVLNGRDYYISVSAGAALYPGDSAEVGQLLKYADMAMYAAKYQGKNRLCYFDSIMKDMMENNVQMENVIRRAVEKDLFSLVYQPQYQTESKKLRGFETLIRLSDGKGKQVSPADFIPVAEKTSLIIDVDKWVLKKAMQDFKPFIEKSPDIILSINISALHMLDDCFLRDIDEVLEITEFPAENLEIELTESVFIKSIDRAKEVMIELKKRGVHIALDDFGTGYSSLTYLRELPIDLLKIDKAFIDSIKNGPKEKAFVAAIISLSQLMRFAVISEGVEEEYQLSILRKLGCDYIQGFLWGKPQLLEDVKNLLEL